MHLLFVDGLSTHFSGNIDDPTAQTTWPDTRFLACLLYEGMPQVAKPRRKSLDLVRSAFGKKGITLHYFIDEQVPFAANLQFNRAPPELTPDNTFTNIKQGNPVNPCGTAVNDGHFGTRKDRELGAKCLNVIRSKALVFRYAIMGQVNANKPGHTGQAELGGNDILLSLGKMSDTMKNGSGGNAPHCQGKPKPSALSCGQIELEAGVIMHELGHSLGLQHGGGDFMNCKPNYFSVMSYSYQYRWFDPDRPLSYSTARLRTLAESNLVDSEGVGGPAPWKVVFGKGNGDISYADAGTTTVDWDGDAATPDASQDINFIYTQSPADPSKGFECGSDDNDDGVTDGIQDLVPYEDWSRLKFSFRESSFYYENGAGITRRELSDVDGEAILLSVDSDGDGIKNGLDNCPGVANPDQIDSNGDGHGDACEGPLVYVDLVTALSLSDNPAQPGQEMTLQMSVSNIGETASGPVTAELMIPEEVRFLAVASSGPWTCTTQPEDFRVTCTVADMEPGATKTVVLSVKPSQEGIFTFWARAETEEPIEVDSENNEVTSDLTVLSCIPTTCSAQGATCGSIPDDCGGTLSCGTCPSGQMCDASNTCVCMPETDSAFCSRLGKDCGSVSGTDNCGAARTVSDCGICTSPQVCGGGGSANVCGCTSETDAVFCSRLGKNCGSVTGTDNCGLARTVSSCGACTSPQSCGGAGTANVCGCSAETDAQFCSRLGKNCGSVTGTDNCGLARTVSSCGACTSPQTCGGGDTANVCGVCMPKTKGTACGDRECGTVSDGCGGTYTCGTCPTGQGCGAYTQLCGPPSCAGGYISTCNELGCRCEPPFGEASEM